MILKSGIYYNRICRIFQVFSCAVQIDLGLILVPGIVRELRDAKLQQPPVGSVLRRGGLTLELREHGDVLVDIDSDDLPRLTQQLLILVDLVRTGLMQEVLKLCERGLRLLAVTGHAPDIRYAVRALLCTAGAAAAAFSVFGPGLWPILLGRTALFAVSFAGLLRLTGTLERSDTVWLRQALRGH